PEVGTLLHVFWESGETIEARSIRARPIPRRSVGAAKDELQKMANVWWLADLCSERHPRTEQNLVQDDLRVVAKDHSHTLQDEELARGDESIEPFAAVPLGHEREHLTIAGISQQAASQTAGPRSHPANEPVDRTERFRSFVVAHAQVHGCYVHRRMCPGREVEAAGRGIPRYPARQPAIVFILHGPLSLHSTLRAVPGEPRRGSPGLKVGPLERNVRAD